MHENTWRTQKNLRIFTVQQKIKLWMVIKRRISIGKRRMLRSIIGWMTIGNKNTNDPISEILQLDYIITSAVINGFKPTSDDKFKESRDRIKYLRNRL